jgi:hypothetical protein
MPEVKWALPKAPKQVEKLFETKKEVTKKDAKKLKPLTKYWFNRLKKARLSDNQEMITIGFLLGVSGMFIISCLIISL